MSVRTIQGPWTYGQGFGVLIAFLVAYAALSAGHMGLVNATIGFEAYLGEGPRLPPHMLIVSQTIKAAALVGVVWLVALHWRGLDWRAVGFTPARARWFVAAIVVALLGFLASVVLAKLAVSAVPEWARLTASRYAWGDAPAWQMLILLGFTIFVTPVAEELFFRGFLLQWLASHRPLWLAILVSSVMFGASHIVPPQAIVAAAMAVLISILYVVSRSVWPCIVCHSLNNALGVGFGMAAEAGILPVWLTPPG
jgi:membrane protease YdiL (CAAX protease family)